MTNLKEGDNQIFWTLSYKGCKNYSRDSMIIRREDAVLDAKDDEYTIAFNSKLEQVNLLGNDFLGDISSYEIKLMNQPENGVLTFENGLAQYQPNANFFGMDVFEYEICNTNCPDKCDRATGAGQCSR